MEENKEVVSFFVHEATMARMERTNHRQWVTIIILIVALIATNLAWIIYESQFEYYEETTVTQDLKSGDGGDANINGDVNIYGKGETDSND